MSRTSATPSAQSVKGRFVYLPLAAIFWALVSALLVALAYALILFPVAIFPLMLAGWAGRRIILGARGQLRNQGRTASVW